MSDTKPPANGDHEERVHGAFDELRRKLGERITGSAHESMEALRIAAAGKDAAAMREHLERVKESDSWLYRELTAHPQIASLINELAVWGF